MKMWQIGGYAVDNLRNKLLYFLKKTEENLLEIEFLKNHFEVFEIFFVYGK